MIVWLSSYPRSGNSYCRFVAYACCGVRSIDRYSLGRPDSRPYFLNVSGSLESLAAAEETYFVKTHDLPEAGDHWPTIYLVRDGRDSLVSYAWFHLLHERKLSPETITANQYRCTIETLLWEEQSPFGGWSDNVVAWLDRAEFTRTIVLRFEEFIQQPQRIAEAVHQLGLGRRQAEARPPTYAELQSMSPRACRRGVVGSWRDEFPSELLPQFWSRHGAAMQRLGYSTARTTSVDDSEKDR